LLLAVLKRAGGLGLGTALGQGIILIGTPWLVRLYGPASFGALALLITATNIAIATGCARFDLAIPSADEEDVTALARLCILIAVGVAAVTASAAFAALRLLDPGGALREILAQPHLLALCVFFAAAFQASSSLLLRKGNVRMMALLRGLQGALFLGLALWPRIGLLWAQTLSYAPACVLLTAALLARDGKARTAIPRGVAAVAAKYRSIALLGLPGAILDVIGYSLCIWIVTSAYGAAGSGELSQVQRIVGAPLMLASISLGQILLRASAETQDDRPALRRLILHLLGLLAAGAAAALVIIAAIGEPVLGWLLGSKWDVGATFIVSLSAAVFVRAAVSPLSAVLATYRRFDLAFRWQLLYFVSAASLFTVASRTMSLDGFVVFYAVHETILYLIYLRLIMSVFRKA
jgi:O-antigen/teichoic acid export membrane protein